MAVRVMSTPFYILVKHKIVVNLISSHACMFFTLLYLSTMHILSLESESIAQWFQVCLCVVL